MLDFVCACLCHNSMQWFQESKSGDGQNKRAMTVFISKNGSRVCSLTKWFESKDTQAPEHSSHNQDTVVAQKGVKC